jgi:hypothetical protein
MVNDLKEVETLSDSIIMSRADGVDLLLTRISSCNRGMFFPRFNISHIYMADWSPISLETEFKDMNSGLVLRPCST